MAETRLNKYLAECGICSRRDADKLICEGRVKVDGAIAQTGQKVTGQERILVDKKEIGGVLRKVVLKYYKPEGVVCTERDEHAKYKVTDAIKYPVRVTYAGRLDKDSEGLLLLTNDGELIERMMRPGNHHEKEYTVKVDKEITVDFLKQMSRGIYLKELGITTRECKIEKLGNYTFSITLTQGVNRQIRRMCKALGYEVTALKRIRVMNINLKPLKLGEYGEVTGEELNKLYQTAGMELSHE